MLQRRRRSAARLLVAATVLACGTLLRGSPQSNRKVAEKKWTVARTPDGQPDLQGVWTNYDPTPFEQLRPEERRPPEPAVSTADWLVQDSPKSPRRPSMVVDPPDGRVPLKPEAVARRDAALALDSSSLERYGPWERCITRGVPGSMWPSAYNNGHQIVQTPGYVVLHSEMIHEARVIPLDGRPHLRADLKSWDGDSRGRWEGDTLIVDVTNFNGETWFDRAGNFHSEALHVVERYTATGPDHLWYEATIDDPKTFTRPWKMSMPLYRRMDKNPQLLEYICVEFAEELMYGHLRKRTSR
jgi:hypothetical protein